MTLYLDTSVLVSLFHADRHTPRALDWIAGVDDFVLSSWALSEFSSALAVKSRMRHLLDKDRRALERQLDQWLKTRTVLSVIDGDIVEARVMVRSDARLRAPDALHLAIAARNDCVVATLDADMAAVACDLGLEVVIP
ncbi:MAG: type II toxin-antitoxin system VapC family toxin [Alphaproteobacteria bacterium]|uniref:type II toxin-antitoxin system VapC family toxin n=1 Tax=Brevundimonas sp. TaxID=1871086 RepID=UPI001A1BF1F7|nr:type II toxin-antitoxin system VapC family toxin [Brevundimonas sp.]MBU1270814.1 type II toxin-antitoxin system VapC family toxin [Alphaproteobacteria bacterium]MBJ7320015.1 type II toxin-antitoxin system VapC family toxin [Brevundimonas sp.]MBU1521189.1 type II toxin-antitoxin system VapC family toxin [Alphaproteobacteria bacterium]MBU2029417.1 type II toxin-antitoxin system VapC family toxin [Alphaproteobacteria bacterium]MBU2165087.1 type II toxin-antitoxin system VapC family toxin [Alph